MRQRVRRLSLALAMFAIAGSCGGPSLLDGEQAGGYRVVYRISDLAFGEVSIRTEVVEVRRPYDGRVEVHQGEPPGRGVATGRVTNRRHLWILEDGGGLGFGALRMPSGPPRDVSYRALADAVEAGAAHLVGADEVGGRRCSWFGYADPVPQPLRPPTQDSRVESCVAPTGIVLREVWTFDGRPARTIQAVELATTPPGSERFLQALDPAQEDVEQPEAAEILGAQVSVQEDGDPGELPSDLSPPEGYELDRQAVVVEAAGPGGRVSQAFVQSYVRDSELVVVERSTEISPGPLWSADEGSRTELGELGTGRVVYFVDRVEVRVTAGWGYARVTAPSLGVALDFAAGLSGS